METTDITKTHLYIQNLIHVIQSSIPPHAKKIQVNGRHSDAFVYILSGSCTYTFDEQASFTVHAGDILYLAHQAHYTMQIHDAEYRYIYCDFEFMDSAPRKSDFFSPANTSDTEHLFRKLLHHHTQCPHLFFADALSDLYRIYQTILLTTNKPYYHQSKHTIQETKNYMDTNFKDTSLSISFLAQMSSMSEVYFRKLFLAEYGISPSQYIISKRLAYAQKLMEYPFLSLEECALQSGFSSVQYFCRVFKNSFGITPGKFRKGVV